MGAATQLLSLFMQIIGGTAPSGAASASGDISQMEKYNVSQLQKVDAAAVSGSPTANSIAAKLNTLLNGSGSIAADIQNFTANGTWTKPANARVVLVVLIGGGAGGAAAANVGPGGGGGGMTIAQFPAAALTSTVSVTVAAAAAGAPQTVGGSPTAGTAGNPTYFGSYAIARGGQCTANSYGPGGDGNSLGGSASPSTYTPFNGAYGGGAGGSSVGGNSTFGGGGGGGGGNSTFGGGGDGGPNAGGATSGANGTAGNSYCGGGGGAGGNADAGGNGGAPGGGGGGGGSYSTTRYAGGNGARGEATIITFF